MWEKGLFTSPVTLHFSGRKSRRLSGLAPFWAPSPQRSDSPPLWEGGKVVLLSVLGRSGAVVSAFVLLFIY